ncbi:MAG: family 10 glycosylhydrolase [Victivallis sp.]
MVDDLKKSNFNTIIFQVRPMNDAFYPSKLNPWSRWMTGAEGKTLGFDPLDFMVKEAHRRNLEFHAWLNPYRVVSSTSLRKAAYLRTLAANNFARKNPHLVLEVKRKDGTYSLLLNPGEPRVVRHILATVREIIKNYAGRRDPFNDYFSVRRYGNSITAPSGDAIPGGCLSRTGGGRMSTPSSAA